MKMLFSAELYSDLRSDSLIDICLKYGQLCDQNDELEEGLYLHQFLMATLDPGRVTRNEHVKEFQERFKKYSEKFPESKILRAIKIENNSPEDVLCQLQKITGITEEKRKWYQRNENLLSRGFYPIPYLIRHTFLLHVPNYMYLWELSKLIGKDNPQYILTISEDRYKLRAVEYFKGRIPLVDDVALVVLFDLGLLEYLFDLFNEIAITKDTILRLQVMAQEFPGSNKAKDIVELLSKHVGQIKQPSSRRELGNDAILNDLELLKTIYDPSIYIFYTDDVMARIYVCGEDNCKDTITSIDIINLMRENKIITKKIAAEKYALLCDFNISGVPINYKDILFVLETDLPPSKNIEYYYKILKNHQNFNSYINAIWSLNADYTKTLGEIGQFMAYMISEQDGVQVENNIITAIYYTWYQKVQFIRKSEKNKLNFFARSFLATAVSLLRRKGDIYKQQNWFARSWKIYDDILKFAYGHAMTRDIENKSKVILADFVSQFEDQSKEEIFNHISSGLIGGTTESDIFNNAYIKAKVQSFRLSGKPKLKKF